MIEGQQARKSSHKSFEYIVVEMNWWELHSFDVGTDPIGS